MTNVNIAKPFHGMKITIQMAWTFSSQLAKENWKQFARDKMESAKFWEKN